MQKPHGLPAFITVDNLPGAINFRYFRKTYRKSKRLLAFGWAAFQSRN